MDNEKAEYSNIIESFLYGEEYGVKIKNLTTDTVGTIYLCRRLERIADSMERIADALENLDRKGITVYPAE